MYDLHRGEHLREAGSTGLDIVCIQDPTPTSNDGACPMVSAAAWGSIIELDRNSQLRQGQGLMAPTSNNGNLVMLKLEPMHVLEKPA